MSDDGRKEMVVSRNRSLMCGVELSSIKKQHFDIRTGESSDLVLPNIEYVVGVGEENHMVSGEALFFPRSKGVSFIMGRQPDTDIKMDMDIIDEGGQEEERAIAEEAGMKEIYERYDVAAKTMAAGIESLGLGKLRYRMSRGDTRISRHQLQISRHPNGATVVNAGLRLGEGSYTEGKKASGGRLSSNVSILRNYSEEPSVHKIEPILFKNSFELGDGDVVIVKGGSRQYCFRLFEAVGKGSLEFKPAMIIKQSYPIDMPISEIHKEIIVGSKEK